MRCHRQAPARRRSRILPILVLAAGLLVSAGAPALDGSDAEIAAELLEPKQVEPITKDQFGQILEHHRGKVLVVNLWATWCIPCLQELPDINLLQKRYRDRGVHVIAVSLDELEKLDESVRPFFEETAPDLVSYLATDDEYDFVGVLDPDWLGALPTTFFLDREGEIASAHAGRLLYKDLEERVLELLE